MIDDEVNKLVDDIVNVHEEVIKKLLTFTGLKLETNGVINIDMLKYEMSRNDYEIISNYDPNVELICLLHKGKKIMTAVIKRELNLEEGKMDVTYKFIKPNED